MGYKEFSVKQEGVAFLILRTLENHALLIKAEGSVIAFPLLLAVPVHHKVQLSHIVVLKYHQL